MSSLPQLATASASSNAGAGATLNSVQLSVQTKNLTSVSSYGLVAYNSTGVPVTSYTGQYPQVTFELPSGTYLFVATADGPVSSQPPICCVCAQTGVVAPPASPPKTSSGPSASSDIALPCLNGSPPLEYGYSLTQVSGSTTLKIVTQSPSSVPTADVSVSVNFKNGTAVSGADVYANVVGADSSWADNSNFSLYAQTDANGVARMVVPAVPLTVTASDSVQVNLTQGQSLVQVNVGGQTVNVTLYYSPNYVYLSASALLIPPQTSLNVVLSAQTQSQLVPYAVGSASSSPPSSPQVQQGAQGAAAVAPSDSLSTTTAQMAAIPPIPASDLGSPASTHPSSSISSVSVSAIGILALAGGIAAMVGIAISKTRR